MFDQQHLKAWAKAIKNGEVGVAPAEGVYGYVADPFNSAALKKLMELKQRDPGKGLIILVPNLQNLKYLCPRTLSPAEQIAIGAYWPCPQNNPVTLLLPVLKNLSAMLTGGQKTIAIRCPATPYMQDYLQAFSGPLVSTSLNISGEKPATRAAQVPAGLPALTLPSDLPGTVSRIFDPAQNAWLR